MLVHRRVSFSSKSSQAYKWVVHFFWPLNHSLLYSYELYNVLNVPSIRFPLLLPILDPDWATDQMVDAVLRNQGKLYLPRILNIFLWIKG